MSDNKPETTLRAMPLCRATPTDDVQSQPLGRSEYALIYTLAQCGSGAANGITNAECGGKEGGSGSAVFAHHIVRKQFRAAEFRALYCTEVAWVLRSRTRLALNVASSPLICGRSDGAGIIGKRMRISMTNRIFRSVLRTRRHRICPGFVRAFNSSSGIVLDLDPGHTVDSNPDPTLGFDPGPVLNFGLGLGSRFNSVPHFI
ncbi:hypothetical protein EVAR_93316_1 [Eumeta japonica]|uniref:Uncharacterized protein n=1 Tax=Eumeta variegata TaxID=151549 RepID=A0A4C1UT83_EUMVA|nr:hypothetical protein EVAR_93316_1 [Eumeta japonica]